MKKLCVLTLVLWCLASVRASGSTINFEGEGKVGVVQIRSNGFPNGVWTYAGELDWSWVGVPADGFTSSWIYTYCIGADDYLNYQETISAQSTNAFVMPGVPDAGSKVAWLLNTYASDIHAFGTGTDAAALQVAIWEALYDNDQNLSGGRFQLMSAGDSLVRTEAQSYLTALWAANYHGSSAVWLDTSASGGQDQLGAAPVPEPASIVLLGCGLAGTWIWRQRSRRLRGIQSSIQQTCAAKEGQA